MVTMGDKCARCGGTLHWYNEKQENPGGEGQICEECIKKDRAITVSYTHLTLPTIYSV